MKIEIIKLNKKAKIPTHGTQSSAGFDLYACLDESVTIKAGETKLIKTGVAIAIPDGYFGMVCPRSGLASKFGITITNSPGIVDSDYRGELMCVMTNLSKNDFTVLDGMRVAQMIIMKYTPEAEFEEVTELTSKTDRGEGGFGSTGL